MAKKVTKGQSEKSNPVTDQYAQTQYARAEHSNPVTEEHAQTQYARGEHSNPVTEKYAQTQYARAVNDNMKDIKEVLNLLDSSIKESFPNASDDTRAKLITKLIDRIK